MNQIYKKLLVNKIDKFIYDFNSTKNLFENLEKRNKLLHPGEFGIYRENICKEILEFAIPQKFNVSSGFLINSYDEISTQCDIVIYDLNNTPLIKEGNNNRFFPVEPVLAVGEMKSTLTMNDLCNSLLKLSNVKKLKKINNLFCVNNVKKEKHIPELDPYDTIFTFLICEKITDFNFEKLKTKMTEVYELNQIPQYLHHNIILSLNDGIITYNNQYTDIHEKIPLNQKMYIPSFLNKNFEICHQNLGKHESVIHLLTSISNFLMNVNIYYPEPNAYN